MSWTQEKIEDILKNYLVINSNTDTLYNCFYKCANKERILKLYNQRNHEIIFGRRGTGKTTLFKALTYYANSGIAKNATIRCIYIDMEDVVPDDCEINTDDQNVLIIETYRKLLIQFLNQVLEFWVNLNSTNIYYDITYTDDEINIIGKKLDVLLDLIVYGEKTPAKNIATQMSSEVVEKTNASSLNAKIDFNSSPSLPSVFAKFSANKKRKRIQEVSVQKEFFYKLNIYSIKKAIDELIFAFKLDRLIICIDEFTRVDKGVNQSIQPFIAQLLKDTFFRNPSISVKVSSLWNDTQIQMRQLNGERIGIELGEDIKRGLDLDTMFFGNEQSVMFFKKMILNTCLLCEKTEFNERIIEGDYEQRLLQYIIESLFSDDETFKLMVCGSQGVPRIFGNLLISAIEKHTETGKQIIDAQTVYDCIIENYKRDVRRKLPYNDEIVCAFDDYITKNKTRFVLVSIADYEKRKQSINGLVNNSFMHQYPSEKLPRNLRNRYKFFLIHLGNYLESLGLKDWRKNIDEYTILYPEIPIEFISKPQNCQLFF